MASSGAATAALQSDASSRMEGWLYLIRFNRIGLQFSRKRYFVLDGNLLRSFKSVPVSNNQDPVRSAIVDSCIRVMDNGRESVNRKVFFIFTLYNTSNHNDQLKFGASRPEEAARWIQSFHEASLRGAPDGGDDAVGCSKRRWQSFRGMKRRDLLLRRYWRREDDGTYVILYHSVFHKKCPPQKGYVRACLKSGGYVISPVNKGKQSVVKHMLAIDWKCWRSYLKSSSAHSITIRMLGRVAALRELFKARLGNCSSSDYSSGELTRNSELHIKEEVIINSDTEIQADENNHDNSVGEVDQTQSEHACLVTLNDADDEFYDVPEPSDCDESENGWMTECSQQKSQDIRHQKLSTAANFVKRLHDLAVQKRGYVDLQEMVREDSITCSYGSTLPQDPTCTLPCSLTETDPYTFLIRGENYLEDRQKVKAKGTLMKMVAADWVRSDKREDDLGGRPGSIAQKYAAQGGPEFFFIVNIQVPGSTTYSLALYYMMNTPVEDAPLLESFIKGDDAFRNSRFKLIPYISKGSWIVKQSVGKKACLVGQALEINYFQGSNYLELGVDIGSSTVARGVVSLVLGYLNHLVIEMAFLIQGNTREELPEFLLGTCRLNHLDASKAVCLTL
ncbi:protein ENHANCED DISEASE RESISTANCE 2-like isoform X2 [Glycine max]|uniref:protein ENHANCED DISEASE RESISTANCE 2-like isoform X2 n=1 Tax=Glycine max TaxID=3847 RepID=UPI001B356E43|nr:protein ENHANCED DISEASE RESISTANCE 2-like isoform X2 [Glycine max]